MNDIYADGLLFMACLTIAIGALFIVAVRAL